MATATLAFGSAYYCPVCGIALERFDFDKSPEEYSCSFCCTQQRPSRVAVRAGWETPD